MQQPNLPDENPPPVDYEVQLYQNDVGWTNLLILSDSFLVMNSLLVKKWMTGKVQMICMNTPCGIKCASNFHPCIDR
jgi:adenine-specific DNA-methyltransferase